MSPLRTAGASAALVTLGIARIVHADLAEDADAIAARYSTLGSVYRPAPHFYVSGSTPAIVTPARSGKSTSTGCTTVIVLGAVSTSFGLRLPGGIADDGSRVEDLLPSVVGAAETTRCGAARADLAELTMEVRSPHAVIETIVIDTDVPPPSLRSVLPHREPGNVPPPQRPGAPPPPAPLRMRAAALEERWRREGAIDVERRLVRTDQTGAARVLMDLGAGCHSIGVLGAPSGENDISAHDMDAELEWVSGGVAAADHTENPDAALLACTGEHALAALTIAGSAPEVPALVVRARTPLPTGLPAKWGPEPVARVAKGLIERRVPAPTKPPFYESLGIGGTTTLAVEVEAGQCYLATVALIQGDAKLLSIEAAVGGERTVGHTDDASSAAIVTFCAGNATRANVEVEVHGASPIWVAAVWPMSRRRIGEEVH